MDTEPIGGAGAGHDALRGGEKRPWWKRYAILICVLIVVLVGAGVGGGVGGALAAEKKKSNDLAGQQEANAG